MIAASARRESSNIAQCYYSVSTPNRTNLGNIRERLQAQQRDIDRFNQMRRRRRWERQSSFRQDLCRKISKASIVPTSFVLGAGVIITSCSCVSPIGRGTIFWESPNRSRYRIIGGLLLLAGSVIMSLNYMFYKRIRTGQQRHQRELELKNHECHLCRGMKSKRKRTSNTMDNVSMDSKMLLMNSKDVESGTYENSRYQHPERPYISRSGHWIGPKITQVRVISDNVDREKAEDKVSQEVQNVPNSESSYCNEQNNNSITKLKVEELKHAPEDTQKIKSDSTDTINNIQYSNGFYTTKPVTSLPVFSESEKNVIRSVIATLTNFENKITNNNDGNTHVNINNYSSFPICV